MRGAAAARAFDRRPRRRTCGHCARDAGLARRAALRAEDRDDLSRQQRARPAGPALDLPAVRRQHRRAACAARRRSDHDPAHRSRVCPRGVVSRAAGCAAPSRRRQRARCAAACRCDAGGAADRRGGRLEPPPQRRRSAGGHAARSRHRGSRQRRSGGERRRGRHRQLRDAVHHRADRRPLARARRSPRPDRQLHAADARGRCRLLRTRARVRRHDRIAREVRRPDRCCRRGRLHAGGVAGHARRAVHRPQPRAWRGRRVTLFKAVGSALEDLAAAELVFDRLPPQPGGA